MRDQVGQRLDDVEFEDLGDQSVKNITRPIRVFRVRLDPDLKIARRLQTILFQNAGLVSRSWRSRAFFKS